MIRVVQRGPRVAKHPDPPEFDEDKEGEQGEVDRPAERKPPQSGQPSGMNGDDQRIVSGPDLTPPLAKRRFVLAAAIGSSTRRCKRDEGEDRDRRPQRFRHAASSSNPPQVKPGPNAVISTVLGRPRSISFSRTNMTVGALMLP